MVEAIRERDPDHAVTLACAEPRLPYDRVALSTLLASGADPDTLTLRPQSWYDDQRDRGPPRQRVETLDADAYDRYVLCTGSDALVPPIPGAEHAHVFRGPEDCAALKAHARGSAPSSSAAACSGSRPPTGWPRSAARRRSCTSWTA